MTRFLRSIADNVAGGIMHFDERLSLKFSNMALLCSALVCLIQIHPHFADAGLALRIQALMLLVTRIAVPFFFFSSGYFLAAHVNEVGWWGREMRKRVFTLLIPYVLFCTVYAGWKSLLSQKLLYFSFEGVLSCYGLNSFFPAASPLWYVRCLLVLIFISPVVFWALRKFRWLAIGAVALVYLWDSSALVSQQTVHVLRFSFSIQGLFYFSVGALFRLDKTDLLSLLARCKAKAHYIILVGLGGAISIDLLTGLTGVRVINLELVIPFFLVAVWSFVPTCSMPLFLRGQAFPVYCLHSLFIIPMRMFVWHGEICRSMFQGAAKAKIKKYLSELTRY